MCGMCVDYTGVYFIVSVKLLPQLTLSHQQVIDWDTPAFSYDHDSPPIWMQMLSVSCNMMVCYEYDNCEGVWSQFSVSAIEYSSLGIRKRSMEF